MVDTEMMLNAPGGADTHKVSPRAEFTLGIVSRADW